MRLVKIKKRFFAVGLDWYVLEKRHESANYADLAAKVAEDMGGEIPDMAALRPRQYAFGYSRGNTSAYLKASALAASLRISDSFLGVFRFSDIQGDFWWVCAIKQSLVSAMGDKVFESEEKALASLPGIRDILGDFDQEIVCDTVEKSVEWLSALLMPDYLRRNRLRPVQGDVRAGRLRKALVAIGLILAFAYGVNEFIDRRTAQEAMQRAHSAFIDNAKRKQELLAHPEKHFSRPWESSQSVGEFLHLCRNDMLSQPTIYNGWLLDAVSCDGKKLTVTWLHGPGAAYDALPPAARLTSSRTAVAQTAIGRDTLSGLPKKTDDYREFLGQDAAQRRLYQITQDAGLLLKFSGFSAPEKKTVDGVELVAPWVRGKWELTQIPPSLLLDSSFFKTLELPGLALAGFGYAKNTWSLKGEMYANHAKK